MLCCAALVVALPGLKTLSPSHHIVNVLHSGRVLFAEGDMVEIEPTAKSAFSFALLAKTHEIKLKGYAESESDLQRWVRAFNACINSFTVANK